MKFGNHPEANRMRSLYCVRDFNHDRFKRLVDGVFHRVQVYDAQMSELLLEESDESVVEIHPFFCEQCGAPVLDLNAHALLLPALRILLQHIESGDFTASEAQRREFFDNVKALREKEVPGLLNRISKALWFQGES